jgi:predicted glycoside hydrolase/deacetylase ChbG (UPF0249 family)
VPELTIETATASQAAKTGLLIVNADDWGRDRRTTDRILACSRKGGISSVSAMVFMEDTERAAEIAKEQGLDAGLHLNLTSPFTAPRCPAQVGERQQQLARYLLKHPFARALYHPGLAGHFEYVIGAQLDEFQRLYGMGPGRIDGHHHMHLCANVLLHGLLPPGTKVRRHFSYERGEKRVRNSLFRHSTRLALGGRHLQTDYFFSLPPLVSDRLRYIFSLAEQYVVELETHPLDDREYQFLSEGEIFRWIDRSSIGRGYLIA